MIQEGIPPVDAWLYDFHDVQLKKLSFDLMQNIEKSINFIDF